MNNSGKILLNKFLKINNLSKNVTTCINKSTV